MVKIFALTGAALAVVAAGAVFVISSGTGSDPFAHCRSSAVAGGAGAIGGPFELVNAAGDTVTDADVITVPTLIYFGYTFCPDVCSLDVDETPLPWG